MTDDTRRPLPGSARESVPAARAAGGLDPAATVDVTVVLRRRVTMPQKLIEGQQTVSLDQLGTTYGADPADVDLARSVLTAAGLTVVSVDAPSRRLQVSGPVAMVAATFGTTVDLVTSPDPVTGHPVPHRHRTGELSVPAALDGVVTAVLGIDDRPQARAHFRLAAVSPERTAAASSSFTPIELGEVYAFPAATDGEGQTLAIIELGGGFGDADLNAYFAGLGVRRPAVVAVEVDGARNVAGQDPQGADGEVLLDIEVAGALAPRAAMLVYFGPNTDRGFLDAVVAAVHATPTPTVLSISWGQSEDQWTAQARTALDDAFADAAALGVTVCVASGDNGSSDGVADRAVHVDFPASSPHALACGGTRVIRGASAGAVDETVWNDGVGRGATGGGVSDTFTLPAWQSHVAVPVRAGTHAAGRGVPDVAGNADPATGYEVLVDGTRLVIGGTSAVAPLWAALVCRLSQGLGHRLGLLQPALYSGLTAGATPAGFRDITSGSNGAYHARPGWDACTGLGAPDGDRLLEAWRSTRSA